MRQPQSQSVEMSTSGFPMRSAESRRSRAEAPVGARLRPFPTCTRFDPTLLPTSAPRCCLCWTDAAFSPDGMLTNGSRQRAIEATMTVFAPTPKQSSRQLGLAPAAWPQVESHRRREGHPRPCAVATASPSDAVDLHKTDWGYVPDFLEQDRTAAFQREDQFKRSVSGLTRGAADGDTILPTLIAIRLSAEAHECALHGQRQQEPPSARRRPCPT